MADPFFPNVPLFPGVPPVNRIDTGAEPVLPTLTKDELAAVAVGPQWGIFSTKGGLAIEPDSITAMEYRREFRVADYPIEQGGFESYNKVATPYDIRVTMTKGGSIGARKDFLDRVDTILAALDLFTIVTPERSYPYVNIVRADYRRNATQGATLLTVELQAMEIRTSASVQFSASGIIQVGTVTNRDGTTAPIFGSVHAPSGANPINNGSVQGVPGSTAPGQQVVAM